ncbi:serine hydrolase domain-containing protein [Ancylobacter pratisalsi]|uniref:Serine hydrolase n=1 Tax=Ancylobacter pratisalsi TaxID=1745854 RepID=A0A6P1YPS2_9HYPH|nr:serine hydrolase domain-containing protein [Ancylobacter pratisalsi]QIB33714.1 serine hydrolase [Ancylobacter pratisalsi]
MLGAALVLTPAAHAEDTATFDLDGYLNSVREEYGLPALAAAVVKAGEVVAAAAVGTRVRGREIPVTLDDRFHIGSNTKAMTATLAGMLVDEGKLRWDSRIGDVLGDDIKGMSASLADATLEQLLSHSSGIPDDNEEILKLYFSADAFEENLTDLRLHAIEAWKAHEIAVPQGSPFQYANFGYLIAGAMIEKAGGMPWEQMMYERIFVPLGMASAGLGPQATYGLIDAPVGHRIEPDGSATPMTWGPAADVPQVMAPAGNAHMSILDNAKWAAWNAGRGARAPALLSPETLRRIQSVHVQTPVRPNPPPGTPGTGAYGLGWGIVEFDWAGKPLLTHNGSNSMNLARILIDPEQDFTIVVTTNYSGAAADAATGRVMERLYVNYAR